MTFLRCTYCGHAARGTKTTCGYHADLPQLDIGVEEMREDFRSWWRDRFTAAEIVALAAWVPPLDPVCSTNTTARQGEQLDAGALPSRTGASIDG